MFRAILAFPAAVLLTIMVATLLLLIGLIHPFQWVFALGSRLWGRGILVISGVSLTVEGRVHVADAAPKSFVGNHQSALDIPILFVASGGRIRFMAKNTLFRIPVFGWVLWRYGHAPINRSSARAATASLNRMLDRLREHPVSFVVFPEGTRSPDERLLPFRHGAMKICQRAALPVVPFAIHGSLAVHRRGEWRTRPGPVKLVFAPPIAVDEVAAMSSSGLSERLFDEVARCLAQAGGNPTTHRDAAMTPKRSTTDA